jgi:hypothetical protein
MENIFDYSKPATVDQVDDVIAKIRAIKREFEAREKVFLQVRRKIRKVTVLYWRKADWMTKPYLGNFTISIEDIERDYGLMWSGSAVIEAVELYLEFLFGNLQDDKTEAYFTQDDVLKLTPHPHTSMSVGDIIAIDDEPWMCMPDRWWRIPGIKIREERWLGGVQ